MQLWFVQLPLAFPTDTRVFCHEASGWCHRSKGKGGWGRGWDWSLEYDTFTMEPHNYCSYFWELVSSCHYFSVVFENPLIYWREFHQSQMNILKVQLKLVLVPTYLVLMSWEFSSHSFSCCLPSPECVRVETVTLIEALPNTRHTWRTVSW